MGVEYGRGERILLWGLSIFGLVGVNGAFLYGLSRPGVLAEAMTNPVALAFMTEALVLTAVFAWLLGKWGVNRLSWVWFVALSLLGGMAFALPIALLWRGRESE